MTLPIINEQHIHQHASFEALSRGTHYYAEGMVGELVLRDGVLYTEVAGSQEEPYRVTVHFGATDIAMATCTCPYDWGGWCKHIVAVLLSYMYAEPDTVEVRPPLKESLAVLSHEQLVELVLWLARGDATLANKIDTFVEADAAESSDGASGSQTIDVEAFHRHMLSIFRRYSSHNKYAAAGLVASLEPLSHQITSSIEGGDATHALLMLDALTATLCDRWTDYDDSDNDIGGFFDCLGTLWAEALLTADLSPQEMSIWQNKLEAWHYELDHDYGCDGLSTGVTAAQEGWTHPWVVAAMNGDITPQAITVHSQPLSLIRLRMKILEQRGQINEALNIAMAVGMHHEQMPLLLKLGRGKEAAMAAYKYFLSSETNRATLGPWAIEFILAQGRRSLALCAGEVAFKANPSLSLYKQLQEIAGTTWEQSRESLLAELRTSQHWNRSARIDIFLHEGLVNDAISALGNHPDDSDLVRVMDAAPESHAQWVLANTTARAEAILKASKASHYDVAVEWLRRARAAYTVVGRPADWDAYIRELRITHGRKYKFIELLDRIGMTDMKGT